MSTVQLAGSLTFTPQGSSSFPGGTQSYAVATTPDPKGVTVFQSGIKMLNSPSSYVSLDIGTGQNVTNGDTLYLKTTSPLSIRITQAGSSAQVIQLQGTMFLEFPPTAYLTFLEAQGVGTIEYACSGQS